MAQVRYEAAEAEVKRLRCHIGNILHKIAVDSIDVVAVYDLLDEALDKEGEG